LRRAGFTPRVLQPDEQFEALARWSHPVHGDVPPDRLAELAKLKTEVQHVQSTDCAA